MALAEDESEEIHKKDETELVGCLGGVTVAREHVTIINKLDPAFCLNTNPSGLQGAAETLFVSKARNVIIREWPTYSTVRNPV